MMGTRIAAAIFVAMMMASGCEREPAETQVNGSECAGTVTLDVIPVPMSPSSVRSAVSDALDDAMAISDLNVMAYDSKGLLHAGGYFGPDEEISLEVAENETFTIYALANVGRIEPPLESAELESIRFRVSSPEQIVSSGHIPMSGVSSPVSASSGKQVRILMTRSVAEVSLGFSHDADLEIVLDEVRFEGVAMDMAPFSASSEPERRGMGDFSTGDDTGKLMAEESVAFYLLEDMSSSNDLPPYQNVPVSSELPDGVPLMCVRGRVVNSAGLKTADVDYTLPLDWKIRRNLRYGIEFKATADGIYEDSYRVEVSGAELALYDDRLSIPVGGEAEILVPASEYAEVTFASAWPETVSVDAGGKVRGLAVGTVPVTVHCPLLDASAECVVEVYEENPFTGYDLDEPHYVGQWGRLHFPDATEENPVRLTVGGSEILVGTYGEVSRFQLVSSESHDFYYVPSQNRNTIYIHCRPHPGHTPVMMAQEHSSSGITLENAAYPRYRVSTDDGYNRAVLKDDGGRKEFMLYLANEDNVQIRLSEFEMPEALQAVNEMSPYERFFEDFLDSFNIEGEYRDLLSVEFGLTGWDAEEDYLYVGTMSLLDPSSALDEFKLTLTNRRNGFGDMPKTELAVEVESAFAGQGHLGEFVNHQIDPGDLQSDMIDLGIALPGDAEWEIRRYYPDGRNLSLSQIWEESDDKYVSLLDGPRRNSATGTSVLYLKSPERLDAGEFFANGSYVIRGRKTNPLNGLVSTGYYTLDIVLKVSIIAQVDMVMTSSNSTRVTWNYVPLSKWSVDGYADFWEGLHYVSIYDEMTGKTCRPDGLIQNVGVSSVDLPVGIRDPQYSYDATLSALSGVFGEGRAGSFRFIGLSGEYVDSIRIDRSNCRAYGTDGYYHFVRQQDAGTGLSNCLIEVHYGDFSTY